MQKEEFFAPDSVNYDNINALSKEQAILFEKRICELSEIADDAAELCASLFEGGFGIYELLSLISEGVAFDFSLDESSTLKQNAHIIKNCIAAIEARDKAVFSVLFANKLKKLGVSLSESDFLATGEDNASVVYVKNRLSDEAYDVFSVGIPDATVSYADTLKAAAEAVSECKKEYAILPLEEKGGARLATIASLLFRYDLKIASVTPVFGFDGTADVKYALVSRRFRIPDFQPDDDRYLEIRLRADGSIFLSDLFSAAEMLGASVYRINTVSFQNEDGEIPYYTIVFKDEGNDFSHLLVFLTLFAGSYTAVGIYKNLE